MKSNLSVHFDARKLLQMARMATTIKALSYSYPRLFQECVERTNIKGCLVPSLTGPNRLIRPATRILRLLFFLVKYGGHDWVREPVRFHSRKRRADLASPPLVLLRYLPLILLGSTFWQNHTHSQSIAVQSKIIYAGPSSSCHWAIKSRMLIEPPALPAKSEILVLSLNTCATIQSSGWL